jgi:uncharacterized membrane protein
MSKWHKIIRWVLLALVSVTYLVAGILCFIGKLDGMFHDWGFPAWSVYLVGFFEIVGALALYYTRLVGFGFLILTVITISSILTLAGHHVWSRGEPLPAILLLCSIFGLMYLRGKREDETRWGLL